MAIDELTIRYNSTTHAGSQCNHDKIIHTLGSTIHHFTQGRSIGVIG